jgi:hypothetical protein
MNKQPESWTPYILCGIFAVPCLAQLLIVEPFTDGNADKALLLYGGLGCAVGGAAAILHVVRRLNRHDDPRQAKRPRDAP